MTYAIVAAFIAGSLLLAYRLLSRARVDSVIASLKREESRIKSEKYLGEVARVEQEIKDAKIRYSNAKRTLDSYTVAGPDPVPGADEGVQGSDKGS